VYQAASGGGSSLPFLILIVVLGGGYLLFIRSIQRKQRNQTSAQQNMRSALTPGTEIVTIGGMYGIVVDVDDDSVMLEIADGVTARYDRNAIARVVTPADEVDEDTTDEDAADEDETDATDQDEIDQDATDEDTADASADDQTPDQHLATEDTVAQDPTTQNPTTQNTVADGSAGTERKQSTDRTAKGRNR
jgi:preprotein translocase subunit YajC